MAAAIAKARATLDRFEKMLADPMDGATYSVKLGLETPDDGQEHIWASKPTLTEDTVTATIDNVPNNLPNVKLGEPVTVERDLISDWMVTDADSRVWGGYTLRVIMEQETDDPKRQMLKNLLKFQD